MGSTVFAVALPIALGIVMFGLGLTLTVADFARVVKYPKAAVIALTCQLVVMPVICFGLVRAFGLDGALAVGMMLLAASPGGSSANLFSHLAGGNVALNVTLTAINSVLAVFTLPIVVGLSYSVFLDDGAGLGLQPAKFLQVFAIVLVPVALGMWVRHRWTAWALRRQRTVKIGSGVVLVLVVCAALFAEFDAFTDHVGELGAIALLLCTIGLGIGYGVPRLFGVRHEDAIASSMEIGVHNAALAIAVAATVLNNDTMAVPAAVYGFLMNIPAGIATVAFARSRGQQATGEPGAESLAADRTA
ncbi:bile acid:sodium symporter family protein [Nocardia cyriacigeorgica]|jgi:bile acid:Na+ symporter, BASS family|uniref:bile acid:sodium symporter family protein n=1 Tax=Nocardia cyriacigeorgica TaxID=135487 RepID=UPI0002E04767|nr:bile acid:sodium symporter family protein [Nocardia cyriacigeorgica]AVH22734.1 bile acid:sodium symporter family protein [Nocardia cyriacigeorgica]MBF6089385.1 bile acid:sodium symporter family protein [Nocardia cyriacigeorgica]MBF6094659.1 bile acid:sodium symporter family protein [Nocardia cyriacigeorgica]MBF6319079.1 bile acid:sodium symporter family protein [Nocardia cyriacigeorgica]MBF6325826.1 bile acid:sodium symporter family protein [Nocardia cyriacigeorgica]